MEMKLGIDIENLSRFKRILLIILPSLAIAAIFATMYVMPAFEEVIKLETEVNSQNAEINLLKIHSAKLPTLIAENEKLQKRLNELQMRLPEEKEVSGLLRQVSALGVKAGLEVALWKPKAKVVHVSKEVYEIPVEVQMRGNYHNFGEFFSNLTKLDRIVNLNDINMKIADAKIKKGATGLNVNFTSVTYSLISEAEKKQLEEQEKAKEKK